MSNAAPIKFFVLNAQHVLEMCDKKDVESQRVARIASKLIEQCDPNTHCCLCEEKLGQKYPMRVVIGLPIDHAERDIQAICLVVCEGCDDKPDLGGRMGKMLEKRFDGTATEIQSMSSEIRQ